jgi:hypothetical protein
MKLTLSFARTDKYAEQESRLRRPADSHSIKRKAVTRMFTAKDRDEIY